ncbi:hypothetical protein D9757_006478 [Collybiopsis confluens]|uniref:Uncharacterized protein n=1 Tax=Collybiopsis confluens TaxID=2823264 RepID=A0A8H5HJX5_9AGAR|nr:hypothetical protein D9757_006478 [Collybiopsis confluens]
MFLSLATLLDPAETQEEFRQAESVRHHLGVPILFHSSMKPSYSCIKQIRSYFHSLSVPVTDEQLIIVGDRLFTDIVMANRFREKSWSDMIGSRLKSPASGPHELSDAATLLPQTTLGIWTTGVWVKEATFMRLCERKLLAGISRWFTTARVKIDARTAETDQVTASPTEDHSYADSAEQVNRMRAFVHPSTTPLSPPEVTGYLRTLVNKVRVGAKPLFAKRQPEEAWSSTCMPPDHIGSNHDGLDKATSALRDSVVDMCSATSFISEAFNRIAGLLPSIDPYTPGPSVEHLNAAEFSSRRRSGIVPGLACELYRGPSAVTRCLRPYS